MPDRPTSSAHACPLLCLDAKNSTHTYIGVANPLVAGANALRGHQIMGQAYATATIVTMYNRNVYSSITQVYTYLGDTLQRMLRQCGHKHVPDRG